MAWAIFDGPFRFDWRPKKAICLEIKPSPTAQSYPRDVIDAAVAAGKARRVTVSKRSQLPTKPETSTPERKSR